MTRPTYLKYIELNETGQPVSGGDVIALEKRDGRFPRAIGVLEYVDDNGEGFYLHKLFNEAGRCTLLSLDAGNPKRTFDRIASGSYASPDPDWATVVVFGKNDQTLTVLSAEDGARTFKRDGIVEDRTGKKAEFVVQQDDGQEKVIAVAPYWGL